jgi:DNA polymerase III alpha subunit (gram-positive type)
LLWIFDCLQRRAASANISWEKPTFRRDNESTSHFLGFLAKKLNVPTPATHRASDDVQVLLDVLQRVFPSALDSVLSNWSANSVVSSDFLISRQCGTRILSETQSSKICCTIPYCSMAKKKYKFKSQENLEKHIKNTIRLFSRQFQRKKTLITLNARESLAIFWWISVQDNMRNTLQL